MQSLFLYYLLKVDLILWISFFCIFAYLNLYFMRNLVLIFTLVSFLLGCTEKGYLRTLDDFEPMIIKHLGMPSVIDSTQEKDCLVTFYIFQDDPNVTFEKVNRFLINGTRDPSYTWKATSRHKRGGLWPMVDDETKYFDATNTVFIIQFDEYIKYDGHRDVYICTLNHSKRKK